MEKKLKKIIIILIVVICIILALYFILKNKNSILSGGKQATGTYDGTYDKEINLIENLKEVDSRNWYYVVKNICEKYFNYIELYNTDTFFSRAEGNVTITPEEKENNFKNLYNLYDIEYMTNNNITEENIRNDLVKYDNIDDFSINKMYYQDIDEDITAYVVETALIRENQNTNESEEIIVKIDKANSTFAIVPINQEIEVEAGDKFELSDSRIQKNTYNQYDFQNVDDTQIIQDFLDKYRKAALYNTNLAYELLDEEYRNKRFGNYETFLNYVQSNLKEISTLNFTQYLINYYDDYTEYVCKDKYENLYIFRETSVMNYKLLLDTYTIPTDEFKQQYQNSSNENKVKLNIDKWFDMINNRDYKNAFNYLDETFRTNNLKNDPNTFEAYMREQYPLHYQVLYGEITERHGTYVQSVKLKDITGEDSTEYMLDIIMQLQDDMNFVMSFTMQTK